MLHSLRCPSRQTRAIACASTAGFLQRSNNNLHLSGNAERAVIPPSQCHAHGMPIGRRTRGAEATGRQRPCSTI